MREPKDPITANLPKEVGKRVRDQRIAQHITTEKLAEEANISVQYLNLLERGEKCMSIAILVKLAAALHCSCDYLLRGQTELSPICDTISQRFSELTPLDRELVADLLRKTCDTIQALGLES